MSGRKQANSAAGRSSHWKILMTRGNPIPVPPARRVSIPGLKPRPVLGDVAPGESLVGSSFVYRLVDRSCVEDRAAGVVIWNRVLPRLAVPGDETLGSTAKPAQRLEHDRVLD
jgi:hypothetical protein